MRNLLFFFLPVYVAASPIGIPSDPTVLEGGIWIPDTSWCSFRAGFAEDIVVSKKYQGNNASSSGNTQIFSAIWNIRERLDIQALLGWGQMRWQWNRGRALVRGRANGGLYWGGSVKLLVFEIKNTSLGIDFHGGGFSGGQPVKAQMRYWQAAIGVSQKIFWFFPYVGLGINQQTLRLRTGPSATYLRSKHRLGPFFGFTLSNGSIISFNVEGRTRFENAATVSCEARF